MKIDNYDTQQCARTGDPTQGTPGGTDSDGSPLPVSCTGLAVSPDYAYVEDGGTFQFRALLSFSDGSVQDVTDSAIWTANGVATIDSLGLATASAAGYSTITCTSCGKTGYGTMQVVAGCESAGYDFALVLDRSSGVLAGLAGHTVEENIRAGAKNFLANLGSNDQAALISFAGIQNPGPPATGVGEATVDHILSNDSASLAQENALYGVRGPCPYPTEAGPGTRCSRGLGTALQVARTELDSGRHVPGRQQVLILIFTGSNLIALPDAETVAQQCKDDGIIICVIGIQVPAFYTTQARKIANCGWYFPCNDGTEIPAILASLPHQICYSYTGSCYYSVPKATCDSPPAEAADICGLRWEMPCIAETPGIINGCTCSDPTDVVAVMGGTPGQLYNVGLRFVGVMELKHYEGGTNDGKFFQTGGFIVEDTHDGGYGRAWLEVSDPPQTYYLNRRWGFTPEEVDGDYGGIVKLDYTATVQIKGAATVKLVARSQDGLQFKNYRNFQFDDVIPIGHPYNGQFLEMRVSSVTPV